ncbi:MAG TPA: hypothetical protein DCG38_05110, partial [Eubacteriaceae bacterium]|nr:hypothetical protein [Eubacteriaceae bacterium]
MNKNTRMNPIATKIYIHVLLESVFDGVTVGIVVGIDDSCVVVGIDDSGVVVGIDDSGVVVGI